MWGILYLPPRSPLCADVIYGSPLSLHPQLLAWEGQSNFITVRVSIELPSVFSFSIYSLLQNSKALPHYKNETLDAPKISCRKCEKLRALIGTSLWKPTKIALHFSVIPVEIECRRARLESYPLPLRFLTSPLHVRGRSCGRKLSGHHKV